MNRHRPQAGHRRGLMVAFVGVDGAGKSSAIEALLADPDLQASGIKRIYFGSNEFWIPGARRLNARLDRVPFLKYFARLLLVLDRQLRLVPALYYRRRGHLVVCDRFYYDDIVARRLIAKEALQRPKTAARFDRLKSLLRPRMLRRPDLTLYLDVSPETAYRRKQDYPFDVMLRLNKTYKEVMASYPEVVFIDAEQPRPAIHQQVVEHLRRLREAAHQRPSKFGSVRRAAYFAGRHLTDFSLARPGLRHFGEWLLCQSRHWHPYVDREASETRARVVALDRNFGRGEMILTGTGALQHVTEERVRTVPLGRLAERSLSAGYENWLTLREGPHARLVDYDFVKVQMEGVEVYSAERMSRFECRLTDVADILDVLLGEFSENQFSDMSFDAARHVLADVALLSHREVNALVVLPEAGFHGLIHGDLYCGNLLRNKAGQVVMIDLDRVRSGPQLLDRIHSAVVHTERQRGRSWLTFFSTDVRDWFGDDPLELLRGVSRNSLWAYFLWRQWVEIQGMSALHRTYAVRLRACFHRLVRDEAATDKVHRAADA